MTLLFPDDDLIELLTPLALDGDPRALAELRRIYERGEFDPGFGRDLSVLLDREAA